MRWTIPHDDARSKSIPVLLQASRASFAAWERWSASDGSVRLLFGWAIAEATVWPILPDFLLIPLVLGKPRRVAAFLVAAIGGMMLGGIGLYLFAFRQPAEALRLLPHLPTVRAAAVDRARKDLAAHGLVAFLFQPFTGVPFKVWALLAGSEGRSPLHAIPLFIISRSARMAVLALAARFVGMRFRPFLSDYFLVPATMYPATFFYVWRRLIHA